MKRLRLGTRGSLLAQTQARWVSGRLQEIFQDLRIDMIPITTSGDRASSGRLAPSGAGGLKALFTKEIDEALLDGRIDAAVHSMKDLPAELPEGLELGAVPQREDPRDAWISRSGVSFQNLLAGARVGTGAVRRQAQLRRLRPDLVSVPMRGNVETRLRKIEKEGLDGVILALAGLRRLGRENDITDIFPAEYFVPALGQGALAVAIRAKDAAAQEVVGALDHPASRRAVCAERAFLQELGGSCQSPIAGWARGRGRTLRLSALVLSLDGRDALQDEESGSASDPAAIGRRLAQKLLARGAAALLPS